MGNQTDKGEVSREMTAGRMFTFLYNIIKGDKSMEDSECLHVIAQRITESKDTKDNEPGENKTLMRFAQDLGVDFSAAKMIYDKGCRDTAGYLAEIEGPEESVAPPPGPTMTDDEALGVLDEMVNKIVVDPAMYQDEIRTIPRKALAHLRRRLQDAVMYERKWSDLIETTSTRTDQNKPKRVTREWVQKYIPCRCIDAYKDRGIAQPDCPYHAEDIDGLLKELGYEVEEAKP